MRIKFVFILILAVSLVLPRQILAMVDSDGDRVSDQDEQKIYYTNPFLADSDGDGYSDWLELNTGYSPHNPQQVSLEDNDQDNDGLSDRLELDFHTNLLLADSDGDGYTDGDEVINGYNPVNPEPEQLGKKFGVDTGNQEFSYFLGGVRVGKFLMSSGINNSTPLGSYHIINKVDKAWSPYGLWMPYWMGLGTGKFGIHELPIWPNGYREGEDHLGTAVSHGCIRLGLEAAEMMYSWAEIGTPVIIY